MGNFTQMQRVSGLSFPIKQDTFRVGPQQVKFMLHHEVETQNSVADVGHHHFVGKCFLVKSQFHIFGPICLNFGAIYSFKASYDVIV